MINKKQQYLYECGQLSVWLGQNSHSIKTRQRGTSTSAERCSTTRRCSRHESVLVLGRVLAWRPAGNPWLNLHLGRAQHESNLPVLSSSPATLPAPATLCTRTRATALIYLTEVGRRLV